MRRIAALLLGCLLACTATLTHAASIVKATYSQGTNTIALMIYTGPDGGPSSDSATYWALLGKSPEAAYRVKIKPDRPKGKTATLKGDIGVSVEIRNPFNMGAVKTDKLTLVRDDSQSSKWYVPAKELKRLQSLISKNTEKRDSESQHPPAKE